MTFWVTHGDPGGNLQALCLSFRGEIGRERVPFRVPPSDLPSITHRADARAEKGEKLAKSLSSAKLSPTAHTVVQGKVKCATNPFIYPSDIA